MALTATGLLQALTATLNEDREQRQNAEAFLTECRLKPGYLISLVDIVSEHSLETGLRSVAAISLKNEVRGRWKPYEEQGFSEQLENKYTTPNYKDSSYSSEEKQIVRDRLFVLLCGISLQQLSLRKQIDEIVYQVVLHDYPSEWPQCGGLITQCLDQRENVNALLSGLSVLRKVCRKYEMSIESDEENSLHLLIQQASPRMLKCMEDLGNRIFETQETSFITKMICKVYWSITNLSMSKSSYLFESQPAWMEILKRVVETPVPFSMLENLVDEELDQCFALKAKKWAMQTLRRFVTRFGTPRIKKNDEDKNPFAIAFAQQYAVPFLMIYLKLQQEAVSLQESGRGNGYSRDRLIWTPRLHVLAIEYMTQSLESATGYKALKPHVEYLITKVAHPMLSYNEQDVDAWETDPIEYIKDQTDVFSLVVSPREAAAAFVRSVMRLRGKDFLEPVASFVMSELEVYRCAPESEKAMLSPLARRKDGALVMLGSFSERLVTKKRKLEIEQIVYNHIAPELLPSSQDRFLKRRAAWVLGRLFDTEKSLLAKEGSVQNGQKFVETFGLLVRCCNHPEIPIRLESIASIASFFDIPFDPLRKFIADNILEIVDVVVATIEVAETAEIAINTLESLVLNFETDMAPFALRLVTFLVTSYLKLFDLENATPATSGGGSPFSLSSEAIGDEGNACTMLSVCKTINSFLEILVNEKVKARFDEVVPICFPYLDCVLQLEGLEYFDEGLQTLTYLTYHSSTFHPMFWKYYERLYQAVCGGDTPHLVLPESHKNGYAADEVQCMLASLDNYCQRDRVGFSQGRCDALQLSYKEMMVKMIEKCFFGHCDSDGPAYALQLTFMMLDAFVEDMTPLQDILPTVLDMLLLYTKKPDGPVARSMKENITKIMCTLLYAVPEKLFAYAEAKKQIDYILTLCVNVTDLKSSDGKKVFLLAFTKLLRLAKAGDLKLPAAMANSTNSILSMIGNQVVELIKLRRSIDQDDGVEEDDWSDDSEQELDENEDAKPLSLVPESLLARMMAKSNEEEEDEYEIDLEEEMGVRMSPLDVVDELAVCQNFLSEFAPSILNVLGQEAAVQLNAALEAELRRRDEARAQKV